MSDAVPAVPAVPAAPAAADTDLGLTLPLAGVQLIDASAGTGKTFTLATLVARLVIDGRLPVDAILAVTFTEAATSELRTRIRERLRLAALLAARAEAGSELLAAGAGEDERLTAQLVSAALPHESATALRQRLGAAAEAMDLAPVLTIHGFCRRALAEHALEAGQPPGEIELLKNESALLRLVATDLWREFGRDPLDARLLLANWRGPEALAGALKQLDDIDLLLPEPGPPLSADDAQQRLRDLAAAAADIALAFALHGAETRASFDEIAAVKGVVDGRSHGDRSTVPAWAALSAWALGGCAGEPADPRIALFASERLAKAVNKAFQGKVTMPANALTDALQRWCTLSADVAGADLQQRLRLLHRLRAEAAIRLAALKRERRQQGFSDLIRRLATALAGEHGEALAQRLRAQFRVALVDEFQDTDPQQWAIFQRLFAQAPDDGGLRALVLIGDPKQAIYRFRGGDVHTYLAAAADIGDRATLTRNFRSRPRALRAVQALYDLHTLYAGADERPFGEDGIVFEAVTGGGGVADDALRIAGDVAPGLQVATWPEVLDERGKPEPVAATRARATTACVAEILSRLAPGRTTVRLREDGADDRALRPGDIAVLVEVHAQAQQVLQALQQAGVPAVAAGRDSLFASVEAQDLLCLFEGCLHLADDSRLRAALATPLLGQQAGDIAALDDDGDAHRAWQDRALGWQQRWQRHGPLALVADLCAAQAPRLLALEGGERRLSNWLQLAELQQVEAAGETLGRQLAWLQQRIADADDRNDDELPRLESDADRVRVMTVHASKGLEFPLVFLPYAFEVRGRSRSGLPLARFHDDVRRRRIGWLQDGDEAAWKQARDRDDAETDAEKLRLLYVALTRAQLATWVGFGPGKDAHRTALATLLFGDRAAKPVKIASADLALRLQELAAAAPAAIVIDAAATQLPAIVPTPAAPPELPPPPVLRRVFARDWWVHSFSALSHEGGGSDGHARADDIRAGSDERGAGDESEPVQAGSRFAGSRFGNVLHAALENVDFGAWRDAGEAIPAGQQPALAEALRDGGYATAEDQREGLPLLAALVRATLNARLPEGLRLAELAPAQRLSEMEFHFALAPVAVPALLARLQADGLLARRRGFGARQRLEGLLTGFIDLVYEHAGRFYLLDYKSNQLPAYDPATLAAAVADSEYDLQYLLYTIALHRWLRFRLPDYDYERHFGGIRYLFCRGLRADDAAAGVHAPRLPRALVEDVDALLGGGP